MVTVAQILGAAGRIAAGRWSDKAGSRLQPDPHHRHRRGRRDGPARADRPDSTRRCRIAVMVVASVITVSDNGLAFTAIAEIAGPVLERPRARHAEHQPTADGGHRAAAVRRADRRGRLPAGVRACARCSRWWRCRWCRSTPTRCASQRDANRSSQHPRDSRRTGRAGAPAAGARAAERPCTIARSTPITAPWPAASRLRPDGVSASARARPGRRRRRRDQTRRSQTA